MASYIDKRALLSGLKWLLPLGLSVACYIWLSSHQERLIALAQSQGWILLYPRLLDLLALSPLLIALHLFSRVAQQAWARGLTISLRLGFFASIVLALSQPTRFEDGTLSETLYLIDVSDSMTDEALSEAITEIKKRELPETERLGIYSYATEVKYLGDKLESLPEDAEKLRATLAGKERAGSHSASALRSVNAWFHTDRLSRMVIFSDRKSTAGDTLLARQALEKSGVELSVVEPSQSLSKEVAIAALIPPEHPKFAQ